MPEDRLEVLAATLDDLAKSDAGADALSSGVIVGGGSHPHQVKADGGDGRRAGTARPSRLSDQPWEEE